MLRIEFILPILAILTLVNGGIDDIHRFNFGIPSRDGQYAYYVQLEAIKENSLNRSCGGALLNNEWVLTSCNCILNADQVTLRMGNSVDNGYVVTVQSENLYIPEKCQPEHRIADIGLIKLTEWIKFSETIQKIDLPSRCEQPEIMDVSIISNDETNIYPKARSTPYKTIPFVDCQKTYRDLTFRSKKSVYCVKSNGNTISQLGSGGRILMSPKGNVLLGVFNFCHEEYYSNDYPLVFRNVVAHYDFISKYTGMDLPKCGNDELMY